MSFTRYLTSRLSIGNVYQIRKSHNCSLPIPKGSRSAVIHHQNLLKNLLGKEFFHLENFNWVPNFNRINELLSGSVANLYLGGNWAKDDTFLWSAKLNYFLKVLLIGCQNARGVNRHEIWRNSRFTNIFYCINTTINLDCGLFNR